MKLRREVWGRYLGTCVSLSGSEIKQMVTQCMGRDIFAKENKNDEELKYLKVGQKLKKRYKALNMMSKNLHLLIHI